MHNFSVIILIIFCFEKYAFQLYKPKTHFANQWAVRIDGGNLSEANRIAEKYGFLNLGPIIPNLDYYLFENQQVRKQLSRKTRSITTDSVLREPKVLYAKEQTTLKRSKRDLPHPSYNSLEDHFKQKWFSMQQAWKYKSPLNDKYWENMWYLHRNENNKTAMDHNVLEAWRLGYTGKGVVVAIVDDGLEINHPDIKPNYDPLASYDYNDRDHDPTPRYIDKNEFYTDENSHGTKCAGIVAASFNNSRCVVGIAYNAKIGGIKILDGHSTDALEAEAFSHRLDYVDIYSNSWGPVDDGKTLGGPLELARKAIKTGIKEGRNGHGSIYIFSAGNGGDIDTCSCDGYSNSIYTISITSVSESNNIPYYAEACSSTLAAAYSGDKLGERKIATTNLHGSCTLRFTGTSASTPIAAGIVALTLEANSKLTWRDVQHIIIRTARSQNLKARDWKTNGAGRKVSHYFGYGLLDAGAMVKLAKNWNTVPSQKTCTISYSITNSSTSQNESNIPIGKHLRLEIKTDGCIKNKETHVKYLEHVQAIVTISAVVRGDIQIYLTSPQGTNSTLLTKRVKDVTSTGFTNWAFMTLHNWGEQSNGTWILDIFSDHGAKLLKWDLVMHGTDKYVGPNGYEKPSNSHQQDKEAEFLDNQILGITPISNEINRIAIMISLLLFSCLMSFF